MVWCCHQLADVGVGDFIVAVGDVDAKWTRHAQVVAMIRDAGLAVRLSLVTPADRNSIDSGTISSSGDDLESRSVSSLRVQSNLPVHRSSGVSHHASLDRSVQSDNMPSLSRHWGFRRRQKREKKS